MIEELVDAFWAIAFLGLLGWAALPMVLGLVALAWDALRTLHPARLRERREHNRIGWRDLARASGILVALHVLAASCLAFAELAPRVATSPWRTIAAGAGLLCVLVVALLRDTRRRLRFSGFDESAFREPRKNEPETAKARGAGVGGGFR